jgi:prepilin-type processing-associated H-X9-DG protein
MANEWGPLPGPWWAYLKPAMDDIRPAAYKAHRAKFNNAFCDGHVESVNFRMPFVANERYLRQWNSDNQPHLEGWQ